MSVLFAKEPAICCIFVAPFPKNFIDQVNENDLRRGY